MGDTRATVLDLPPFAVSVANSINQRDPVGHLANISARLDDYVLLPERHLPA